MNDKLKNAVLNVPELRFPEFSEILIWNRFGDVLESSIYGPRFNSDDYSLYGNVKTIRGTDIDRGGELKYQQVPLAKLDQQTVDNHRLLDGDLVMITTADCGLTGVFRKQEIDYISSAYGVRLRLNKSGNSYYFKYFFQTRHAKSEIASYIRKATVANLPGSDIPRIKIIIPVLKEQQKIANFLKQVDKRIEKLEKKKEKLEQYKKGIMQKLFSQQIRFKNEDGNDYPAWEEKKLGTIAKFTKGKNISKADIDINGEISCIRYGELYTEYGEIIDEVKSKTNIDSKNLVFSEANDVIIPASGETQLDIATASCVMSNGIALGGDLNIIKSPLNGIFLSYYLNSVKKNDIASLAQGNAVVHLYGKELKTLKINVPIIEEQQKIANFLSAIDKQIEKAVSQIDSSKTFKKGLLQKMFV